MSKNVYAFERSVAYLQKRASENVREGRYGEAMTLLFLAAQRENLPPMRVLGEMSNIYSTLGLYEQSNEVLYEMLQTCEESERGACFYALGENSYAQNDFVRTQDYLGLFLSGECEDNAYNHALDMLEDADAAEEMSRPTRDKDAYAAYLTARALEHMTAGSTKRAKRLLLRSLKRRKHADAYTLLALCYMAEGDLDAAEREGKNAFARAPRDVRVLCLMVCVYSGKGDKKSASRYLLRAMSSAKTNDAWLMAGQCACELGQDELILLIYGRLAKEKPYHSLAVQMAAIACMNTGRIRRAAQLWGRLVRVLDGTSPMRYYHKLALHCLETGEKPERLSYRMQVPGDEAHRRVTYLGEATLLSEAELQARFDNDVLLRDTMMWLLKNYAGRPYAIEAVFLLLSRLQGERVKRMLLSFLLYPEQSDGHKRIALALLSRLNVKGPCFAVLDGQLVQVLTENGVGTMLPRSYEQVLQETVERFSLPGEKAAKQLMDLWLSYIGSCNAPLKALTHERIWPLALEWAYYRVRGGKVSARMIARREGVSPRLIIRLGKRILAAYRAENEVESDAMH